MTTLTISSSREATIDIFCAYQPCNRPYKGIQRTVIGEHGPRSLLGCRESTILFLLLGLHYPYQVAGIVKELGNPLAVHIGSVELTTRAMPRSRSRASCSDTVGSAL